MTDTITHHGVKGMKWGVRKDRAEGLANKYRSGILERNKIRVQTISANEYKQLSKTPVKVAGKNSNLFRVSGSKNEKLKGITYVTTSSRDNDTYVALLDPAGKANSKKFQMTLSAASDLISPSKRERVDSFIKTLDSKMYDPTSRRVVSGREYLHIDTVDKDLRSLDLGLKYYEKFAQSQVHNTPLRSAYFNEVQSRGYNAMIDDADSGMVSKTPIIIFNGASNLKTTNVSKISEIDVVKAREELKW